jgi:pimeloyl-ACP methyl ester carboxylesterase
MSRVTLVLLPGLDGTGIMFEPLIQQLPADWRAIVVRYPGDRFLNYDDLLPRVRDALPKEGRYALLGESFSGPLAIRIAAERPLGLFGMVLCATFATSPAPWLPRSCGSFVQPWMVAPMRRAGHVGARLLGFQTRELRELFVRAQRDVKPKVLAARIRAALTVDVTAELKHVTTPLLYLAARKDHIISRFCVRRIQEIRPDLVIQEFDSPHWVLQTRPGEVIAALRSFIQRCATSAPHT